MPNKYLSYYPEEQKGWYILQVVLACDDLQPESAFSHWPREPFLISPSAFCYCLQMRRSRPKEWLKELVSILTPSTSDVANIFETLPAIYRSFKLKCQTSLHLHFQCTPHGTDCMAFPVGDILPHNSSLDDLIPVTSAALPGTKCLDLTLTLCHLVPSF